MPSDLTSEELKKYLAHQEGAIFTAAHEAPGHGTDVAKAPMTVRRIYSATIANAHVLDGDPQAMKMAPLQGILRPLLQEKDAILPRMFKVTYPVPDLNGNIIMAEEIVGENDPRLAHAHTATIIGREPTRYANEDVSEHYAETAAATITGIPIDFKEAKISVPQIVQNGVTAAFTTGYHPDARAQRLYAEEVGGIPGTLPLEFAHRPKVTLFLGSPEDDTLLRTHIIRARRQRAPLPNELMAILVPTSRRLK